MTQPKKEPFGMDWARESLQTDTLAGEKGLSRWLETYTRLDIIQTFSINSNLGLSRTKTDIT